MASKRGLLLLALPLAAGAALLAVALSRGEKPPVTARTAKPGAAAVAVPRLASPVPVSYTPAVPPRPAAADVVASAAEEARLRGTYQNFRTAVATGNGPMQSALGRAIGGKRDAALGLAQEELARARNERDREIARKTLDALRRQP